MPRREYDSDLDEPPRRRRRKPQKKKSSNMGLILAIVGVGIVFLIAAGVGGYFLLRSKTAPGAGLTDLERLSGRWECTFRDGAGRVYMHKVKEITGNTETATWYRPDGTAYRKNTVEFELKVRGNTKSFRYFNGSVIDENGNTQAFPPGEYVYTLEGDTWTELDQFGSAVIVWTRRR